MTITQILNYINSSIKTSFLGLIKAIKEHKYDVNNFPIVQKIKGRVEVSNFLKQQKVLVDFPDIQKVSGSVTTDTKPYFEDLLKKLDILKKIADKKEIAINNFPDIPKEIKIKNFPKAKEVDFSILSSKLDSLIKVVGKLPKRFPDFPDFPDFPTIPEQKDIIFPKKIGVSNLEILKSKNAKNYVPVRLTDGNKFYNAIEDFVVQATRIDTSKLSTSAKQDETKVILSKLVGMDIGEFDKVTQTRTVVKDIWSFELDSVATKVVTITYVDSTKEVISTIVLT